MYTHVLQTVPASREIRHTGVYRTTRHPGTSGRHRQWPSVTGKSSVRAEANHKEAGGKTSAGTRV